MKIKKEKDNLIHIKCPKCGWDFACKNTKTGLIFCAYCQYRKNEVLNEK